MSKLHINIGNSANDRSGDPLRIAFDKVNQNFDELYANLVSYLPNPADSSGKFLSTNGTDLLWASAMKFIQSSTPPTGDVSTLWYDQVSGRMYTWYDDTWVDASPALNDYKLSPPTSPQGAIGDVEGQWSGDFNYYYYCSANFTGNNAPIWRRIAFDSSNNWDIYNGGGGSSLPPNAAGYLYNNGSGTIVWTTNTQGYVLPPATTSVLGGVQVDGVTIISNSGVISATPQVNADWNSSTGASSILNKPSIPAPQIQSDWNVTDNTLKSFIKNKPSIPTISNFSFSPNQITVSNNGAIRFLTNTHSWSFNSNGTLTYPDNSIQLTAYTGTTWPSQTGNGGKFLTTDGNVLSWASVAGGGATWPVNNTNGSGGPTSFAIGQNATTGSGINSIALGVGATSTGNGNISIGRSARGTGNNVITIGYNAGNGYTGNESILIGATGTFAGNSIIVLNATGSSLTPVNYQSNSFYVSPIRSTKTSNALYYDTTTKEVTYGSATQYHLGDDIQYVDIDLDNSGVPTGVVTIQSGFDTGMPVYIKGGNCSNGGVGGNVVIEAGGAPLPNTGTTGDVEISGQQVTVDANNKTWTFRDSGNLETPDGHTVFSSSNSIGLRSQYGAGLIAGQVGLVFEANGTVNVQSVFPRTFTAVLDTAHMIYPDPAVALDPMTDPWQMEVAFDIVDGQIVTTVEQIFPILTNPGYVTGYMFGFTDADHGIPGYGFSIELQDVVLPGGAGWTANIVVPPAPALPSTIRSASTLVLTGDDGIVMDGRITLLDNPAPGKGIYGPSGLSLYAKNGNQLGLYWNADSATNPYEGIPNHDAKVVATISDWGGYSIDITTDATEKIWTFQPNGNLKFPNHSIFDGQTLTDHATSSNYTLKIANGGEVGSKFGIGTGDATFGIANDALNHAENGYVPYTITAQNINLTVPNAGTWTFGGNGNLTFPDDTVQTTAYQQVSVPVTSKGVSGDVVGRIAFDSDYIYYCTASYDGDNNIWKRVALSTDTWDNTPPPITYTLVVSVLGDGIGIVTSDPAGISAVITTAIFAAGTTVTLSAAPQSGSNFAGWGGAANGTGPAYITMTDNQSVTATFNANPPPPPPPTPTLVSIDITPANSFQFTGNDITVQFTATGTYSDGSNADLTNTVTWGITEGFTNYGITATGSVFLDEGLQGTDIVISASLDGISATTLLNFG